MILASRTRSKLNEVSRSVSSSSNITPDIVELDLASQRSIRAAAAKINALVSHVDILIQNAAVVSSDRHETEDGIEQTFGTNHVGHFLLTSLLMPRLIAPPRESRVINVTSLGYRLSPVRFHDYNFTGNMVPPEEQPPPELPPRLKPDPQGGRPYQGFCAYGQSKTANILHCVSLNKKYANSGLRAFAVHPGCKFFSTNADLESVLTFHPCSHMDRSIAELDSGGPEDYRGDFYHLAGPGPRNSDNIGGGVGSEAFDGPRSSPAERLPISGSGRYSYESYNCRETMEVE